jgi:hypothetical protein
MKNKSIKAKLWPIKPFLSVISRGAQAALGNVNTAALIRQLSKIFLLLGQDEFNVECSAKGYRIRLNGKQFSLNLQGGQPEEEDQATQSLRVKIRDRSKHYVISLFMHNEGGTL